MFLAPVFSGCWRVTHLFSHRSCESSLGSSDTQLASWKFQCLWGLFSLSLLKDRGNCKKELLCLKLRASLVKTAEDLLNCRMYLPVTSPFRKVSVHSRQSEQVCRICPLWSDRFSLKVDRVTDYHAIIYIWRSAVVNILCFYSCCKYHVEDRRSFVSCANYTHPLFTYCEKWWQVLRLWHSPPPRYTDYWETSICCATSLFLELNVVHLLLNLVLQTLSKDLPYIFNWVNHQTYKQRSPQRNVTIWLSDVGDKSIQELFRDSSALWYGLGSPAPITYTHFPKTFT